MLKPYTHAEIDAALDSSSPIDSSSSWERVLLTIEAQERAEAACARKFNAMRAGMVAVGGHYECLDKLEKAFHTADPLWNTDNPGKGYASPEQIRQIAEAVVVATQVWCADQATMSPIAKTVQIAINVSEIIDEVLKRTP